MSRWGYIPSGASAMSTPIIVRLSMLTDPDIYEWREQRVRKVTYRRRECTLSPEAERSHNAAYREKVRELIRAGGDPELLAPYLGQYDQHEILSAADVRKNRKRYGKNWKPRWHRIYLCDFCGDALLRERELCVPFTDLRSRDTDGDGVRLLFGNGRICDDCRNRNTSAAYNQYWPTIYTRKPRKLKPQPIGKRGWYQPATAEDKAHAEGQILEFANVLREYFDPEQWKRRLWKCKGNDYLERLVPHDWPSARITLRHEEYEIYCGHDINRIRRGAVTATPADPENKYRLARRSLLAITSEYGMVETGRKLRELLPRDPHEIRIHKSKMVRAV